MTLEQVFYLTQSVAAVGVLASLIFLGLQTRDSAKAVRSATTQAVQENFSTWCRSLAEHPALLAACAKGFASPSTLSVDERLQFFVSFQSLVHSGENAFTQWRNGHLPEGVWTAYERPMALAMRTPGGLVFWRERRWIFSEAFQSMVDAAITKPMDAGAKLFGVIPVTDMAASHSAEPPVT
jgi:hypothetical protein